MDADVCIVGAGAAGGVLALELARRGVRVVVLESGPRHDLARRREYVRRYLGHQNPWRTPLRELDRHTVGGPQPYRLEGKRARGVGGSTLHWEGYACGCTPATSACARSTGSPRTGRSHTRTWSPTTGRRAGARCRRRRRRALGLAPQHAVSAPPVPVQLLRRPVRPRVPRPRDRASSPAAGPELAGVRRAARSASAARPAPSAPPGRRPART